jgi:hypothetical protein
MAQIAVPSKAMFQVKTSVHQEKKKNWKQKVKWNFHW